MAPSGTAIAAAASSAFAAAAVVANDGTGCCCLPLGACAACRFCTLPFAFCCVAADAAAARFAPPLPPPVPLPPAGFWPAAAWRTAQTEAVSGTPEAVESEMGPLTEPGEGLRPLREGEARGRLERGG